MSAADMGAGPIIVIVLEAFWAVIPKPPVYQNHLGIETYADFWAFSKLSESELDRESPCSS